MTLLGLMIFISEHEIFLDLLSTLANLVTKNLTTKVYKASNKFLFEVLY